MNNLLKLAERVDGGEDTKIINLHIWEALGGPSRHNGPVWDLISSLNAAKALHDEVLPGWNFSITSDKAAFRFVVQVWPPNTLCKSDTGISGNPAAAWVAAILRAKADD